MAVTAPHASAVRSERSYDLSVQISDIFIETVLDTAFVTDTFQIESPVHSHPYYELQFCIRGACRIVFPEQSREAIVLQPPMLCLIPPDVPHHVQPLTDNAQKLAVRFTWRQTQENNRHQPLYASFHKTITGIREPFTAQSIPIFQLIGSLRQETLSHSRGADVYESLLLSQIYLSLWRMLLPAEDASEERKPAQDSLHTRYIQIDRFFNTRYMEPVTEKDLAALLSLGERQVVRILHTIYGMSFQEMLTDNRLSKAEELMLQTELSLEKIGELVGYTSYSGFFRAFRKKHGVSTREYRKNIAKSDI